MTVATVVRVELLGLAPLPPDLDPDDEGLRYGIALAECRDALTAVAQRLGVRPLHRFASTESDLWDELADEVMSRADGERDAEAEILELMNERGDWHDPEDGLHTVQALIAHFAAQAPRTIVCGPSTAQDLLFDLRALEMILAQAADKDRGFRLAIAG